MRPSDHFFTELDRIAKRADLSEAERAFVRMTAPVVGEDAAAELFRGWVDRYGSGQPPSYAHLGYIAAFIVGEYDDATMKLGDDDWEAIRDVVSAEAESMNLEELTRLMGELVSRGALG